MAGPASGAPLGKGQNSLQLKRFSHAWPALQGQRSSLRAGWQLLTRPSNSLFASWGREAPSQFYQRKALQRCYPPQWRQGGSNESILVFAPSIHYVTFTSISRLDPTHRAGFGRPPLSVSEADPLVQTVLIA